MTLNHTNPKLHSLSLVVSISVVLASWLILFSGMAAAASDPSLMITATTDKNRYLLGEPVYLTIQLRNVGEKPVKIPKRINAKEGIVVVRVTTPQEFTFGYVPLTVLDSDSLPVVLKPGGVAGEVFPIFYGARGWTFPKPGTYQISVSYIPLGERKGSCKAEPLTIVVVDDKAGASLIKEGPASHEAARFLLWQSGDHLRKGIALLENAIDSYPDSLIADYANLALGKSLSSPFTDYAVNRARQPNYRRALEYLLKVRRGHLPRYLQVQYDLAQAKSHAALGQPEQASKLLAQTKELTAAHPELFLFDEQIRRLEERVIKNAGGPK